MLRPGIDVVTEIKRHANDQDTSLSSNRSAETKFAGAV